MIKRIAMALLTILLLPLLVVALSVLFVMAWAEEASRKRAPQGYPQRQGKVGGL
jgi:hypothetical protein